MEDEMAGWHHRLDGRESEWTPGVGDGQGGLVCCDSWGRKESDTTERLNWIVHCVKVQHLLYPVLCGGRLGCFHVLAIVKGAAVNIGMLSHVYFWLLLPDLHTDFSGGRSGGLVCPSLKEFSVCCYPNKGFNIVSKAEVDVFLELCCFYYDSVNMEHFEQYLVDSRTSLNVYWVNQQMSTWINNSGLSFLGPDFHLWTSRNRVHLNPWIKLDWGAVSLMED